MVGFGWYSQLDSTGGGLREGERRCAGTEDKVTVTDGISQAEANSKRRTQSRISPKEDCVQMLRKQKTSAVYLKSTRGEREGRKGEGKGSEGRIGWRLNRLIGD